MCCVYRKRSELFILISTALFVALTTVGSEMCFNCINCNVRLIQDRLIKFSCLIIKIIIIIMITLFQEDNIFGRVANLTYGPQLTNVGMIL